MPAKLVEKNTTETQARVLDELSDGQWHPMSKITRKCSDKKSCPATSIRDTVIDFGERGYFMIGANNSFRMPEKYVRQWRMSRGLTMDTVDSHSPRFFGGILEDDGWVHAPLTNYELLNFRANSGITSMHIQERIGNRGKVTQVEDGLFRILSLVGQEVYDELKEWDEEDRNVGIHGLRLTKDAQRRDIHQLPAEYLSNLCDFYGKFGYVLLRNNMSSVKKHLPDNDDVQQQIYIWVLDAVERYDDSTCIPFAAYLHDMLQRWVHNLNRKSHGRAAADNELKHSRAIANFESKTGRYPSLQELADILDESLEKVTKDSMSIKVVSDLRSATTLDSEDFDIPLVSSERADKSVEARLEKTLLSAALVTSALELDETTRGSSITAFLSIADKTWNRDKRLASYYRSKRSADLSQNEAKLLNLVGEKIQSA